MKKFYLKKRSIAWSAFGVIFDSALLLLLLLSYLFCKLNFAWFNKVIGCEFVAETPLIFSFFLVVLLIGDISRNYLKFKSKFIFWISGLPIIVLSDINLTIPLISSRPIDFSKLNKIEYVNGIFQDKLILEAKSDLMFSVKSKWYETSFSTKKNKLIWVLPSLEGNFTELEYEIQKIRLN